MDDAESIENISAGSIIIDKDNKIIENHQTIVNQVPNADFCMRSLIEQSAIDQLKQTSTNYTTSYSVRINERLSAEEQQLLLSKYGHLNIEFVNVSNNSHAFAAASRKLELHYLFNLIGYVPGKNYHYTNKAYVCEIGGNYIHAFSKDWHNIHYDSPIMDLNDSNRTTNRLNTLHTKILNSNSLSVSQLEKQQKINSVLIDSGTNSTQGNDFLCLKKVQDCKFPADYGIALHSLYDIKQKDIGKAMEQKKMRSLVASMIFVPDMLTAASGKIPHLGVCWEIVGDNIEFSFLQDSSNKYVHNKQTYFAWFTNLFIVTKTGKIYVTELLENIYGIQYLKINRAHVTPNCQTISAKRRLWTSFDNHVILTWKLSWPEDCLDKARHDLRKTFTVGEKFLASFFGEAQFSTPGKNSVFSMSDDFDDILRHKQKAPDGSEFFNINIILPMEFFSAVTAFGLGAGEKKFVATEIFNFFRAKISYILVGKEVIKTGNDMDPRTMYLAAYCIYIYIWSFKYNAGVTLQSIMNQINSNRTLATKGIFRKIFHSGPHSNAWWNFWYRIPYRKLNDWLFKIKHDPNVTTDSFVRMAPKYIDIEQKLPRHAAARCKIQTHNLDDIGPILNDRMLLGNITNVVEVEDLELKPDINKEVVIDYDIQPTMHFLSIDVVYNRVKTFENRLQNLENKRAVKCFGSASAHGYACSLASKYLIDGKKLVTVEFIDCEILKKFIRLIFNTGRLMVCHVKNHNGLIVLVMHISPPNSYRSFQHKLRFSTKLSVFNGYYEEIILRQYYKVLENSNVSPVIRVMPVDYKSSLQEPYLKNEIINMKKFPVPSSVVKNSEHVNNGYTKLMQIDQRFKCELIRLLPGTVALDLCAGPGGFSRYIAERNNLGFSTNNNLLIAASLKRNGDMTNNFETTGYIKFEDTRDECDITDDSTREELIEFVFSHDKKNGVELVVADGGVDGAFPDQEARSLKLIGCEFEIILKTLTVGGRCVVKLYIGETTEMIKLISHFVRNFRICRFYKPPNSNLANGEVYLICLDFLPQSARSVDFDNWCIGLENFVNRFNITRATYINSHLFGDNISYSEINDFDPDNNDNFNVPTEEFSPSAPPFSESDSTEYATVSKDIKIRSNELSMVPVTTNRIVTYDHSNRSTMTFVNRSYSVNSNGSELSIESIPPTPPPRKRKNCTPSNLPLVVVENSPPEKPPRVKKLVNLSSVQNVPVRPPRKKIQKRSISLEENFLPSKQLIASDSFKTFSSLQDINRINLESVKFEETPIDTNVVNGDNYDLPVDNIDVIRKCSFNEFGSYYQLCYSEDEAQTKYNRVSEKLILKGTFKKFSQNFNFNNFISKNKFSVSLNFSRIESVAIRRFFSLRTTFVPERLLVKFDKLKFGLVNNTELHKDNLIITELNDVENQELVKCSESICSDNSYKTIDTIESSIPDRLIEMTKYVFKLYLPDGRIQSVSSDYPFPDMKVLLTKGDGNCLYYALTKGRCNVKLLKEQLLDCFKRGSYQNSLSSERRAEVYKCLTEDNCWGNTDIVTLFALSTNTCVIEIPCGNPDIPLSTITHGNFTSIDNTILVYYYNSHFSAVVNFRTLTNSNRLFEVEKALALFGVAANYPRICWDPFISSLDFNHFDWFVVDIGCLNSKSFSKYSSRIKRIRVLPDAYPLILVEFGNDGSNEYSTDELRDVIETHRTSCDECSNFKHSKSPNWFHLVDYPIIQMGCAKFKIVKLCEKDLDFCDLVITLKTTVTALTGYGRLKINVLGVNRIEIEVPNSFSKRMLRILYDKTLEYYLNNPVMQTVGFVGIIQGNEEFFEVLLAGFTSLYYRSMDEPPKDGFDFCPVVVPPGNVACEVRNSLQEIREAWRVTFHRILIACKHFYDVAVNHISSGRTPVFTDTSVTLYSVGSKSFVVRNTNVAFNYGFGFSLHSQTGQFYDVSSLFDKNMHLKKQDLLNSLEKAGVAFLIMYNGTKIILEPKLYQTVSKNLILDYVINNLDIQIVEGVPGAGKTYYILQKHKVTNDHSEIVLTATRQAAEDLRVKIKKENPRMSEQLLKVKYTTVESALINNHKYTAVETIWFDEAFLKHKGQLFWVALVLEAKRLVFVGDAAQIPYTDRNGLDLKCTNIDNLKSLLPSTKYEFLSTSHRVPQDVACLINTRLTSVHPDGSVKKMYKQDLKTTNSTVHSLDAMMLTNKNNIKELNADHYLVFTQGEKSVLVNTGIPAEKVNTVHEFQGQERVFVVLVRTLSNNINIYCNPNQILTAISRHRAKFMYVTIVKDELFNLIFEMKNKDPTIYYTPKKGGAYVYNSSRNRTPLARQLLPRIDEEFEVVPGYEFFISNDYVINPDCEDPELYRLALNNVGHGLYRGRFPISYSVPYISPTRMPVLVPSPTYDNKNILQTYYDEMRPGTDDNHRRYEAEIFEHSPLHVNCQNFKLGPIRNLPKKRDFMKPVLRTACPSKTIPSQKAFLKAYNERNGGCIVMETAVITPREIERRVNNVFKACFKEGYEAELDSFTKSPLVCNLDSVCEWLKTQPPAVFETLKGVDETSLLRALTTMYSYTLKNTAKPKLEPHPENEFASPQAIAFQEKIVNFIFCPIVRELKHRFQALLSRSKILFTDLSVGDLEELLTERLPVHLLSEIKDKREIDFSKYDKSQLFSALACEACFLKRLGMPEELVELWVLIHRSTVLINREHRFKGYVDYQRKSGDAMTFFGNTFLLMLMLVEVYGVTTIKDCFGIFAGDDSLLLFFKVLEESQNLYTKTTNIFNMEIKVIETANYYFCSRFLIPCSVDNRWYVVPDVLKALIKLGRHDLVSEAHVKEYQISLRDNWVNLGNAALYPLISHYLNARYSFGIDMELLLSAMWNLVNSSEFVEWYYWEETDTPEEYSTLPSLDI